MKPKRFQKLVALIVTQGERKSKGAFAGLGTLTTLSGRQGSTADYDRIQNKAQLSGMTMTDFLTLSALGKEIIVVNGLDAVTVQLKAIGKNLNQLTVLCNMGRITCPDLSDTKRSFGAVFDSICGLMDKGA